MDARNVRNPENIGKINYKVKVTSTWINSFVMKPLYFNGKKVD